MHVKITVKQTKETKEYYRLEMDETVLFFTSKEALLEDLQTWLPKKCEASVILSLLDYEDEIIFQIKAA
jgi:hypothetical protein